MTPKTWPIVPLGNAITHRKQFIEIDDLKKYKRCRVQLHAQGVVLRDELPGAEIKTKKQQQCHVGEFLVAEIDAKLGGYGIVPPDLENAIVSSHYFCFEINTEILDRGFLRYFIKTRSFFDQVASQGSTNYAAIRPGHVLGYKTPLPPITEQRRLVAHIDALAAKIAHAQSLRTQSTNETESLHGKTVGELFKSGSSKGWRTSVLGDYVLNDCYGTSEKTSDDSSGTPILRMGNIQNGRLIVDNLKFLSLRDQDRAKWILQPGDILVNRTNSAELVGKCAVFDVDGEFGFASYIIRLRLDARRGNPRLVASYINSPAGRAYMLSERKQMTGQANVNATTLKALPIALPPLDEQNRIVAYLDNLSAKTEALKKLQAATAAELEALLPSILDKAFRGELSADLPIVLETPARQPTIVPHLPDLVIMQRTCVATFVIKRQARQSDFGVTRHEKEMYFLERHLGLAIGGQYRREKHGPFDPIARQRVEELAAKLDYFTTETRPGSKFINFKPGNAIAQAADEGRRFLLSKIREVDRILRHLATLNTKDTEIAATAYAVWNDFLLDGIQPTDEQIIREIRENWHPKKTQFAPASITAMLNFLKSHNLEPKGVGSKTIVVES